jgi:CheY-like chemotaxis protein
LSGGFGNEHEKTLNLLLIEDDEMKRQMVLAAILKECPSPAVKTVNSVRTAIDTLAAVSFDLVIADMSLPTFDIMIRERGGTPRPFGGMEIFDYLAKMEKIVPVLVVTSYPALTDGRKSLSVRDLEQQLRTDYPVNFAGIVYFDSAYSDWQREMAKLLSEIIIKKC